jgi:vanillate O-demethylase ferredoxin subunit
MLETFPVRLRAIIQESDDVNLLQFRSLTDHSLPPFQPGAHIDLHLPNGLIRSYSLIEPWSAHGHYVITVKNEPAGRGGSRFIHNDLRVGQDIVISRPRNNFPLVENAELSVFIAGGIGITPLFCMARHLERLGRRWEMHYAVRGRESAIFARGLGAFGPKIHPYTRVAPLNIATLVATLPEHTHIYCCGPLRMLAAFEEATASRPPALMHVEYFSAKDAPATTGGFEVVLRRSNKRFAIALGHTILDTLIAAGMDVPFSCMEGICGSCEVGVLDGIPDHRDMILSREEKVANNKMILCCSGSKSATLVLDL